MEHHIDPKGAYELERKLVRDAVAEYEIVKRRCMYLGQFIFEHGARLQQLKKEAGYGYGNPPEEEHGTRPQNQ